MTTQRETGIPQPSRPIRAFTLLELLIVIGIMGILIGILLPVLTRASRQSSITFCGQNMRQLVMAVHNYANDYAGRLPVNPAAPVSPGLGYYDTETPTHATYLHPSDALVGFGLLTNTYLMDPRVMFSPGDNTETTHEDLDAYRDRSGSATGSYFFRQLAATNNLGLIDELGISFAGTPARALAMDVNNLIPGQFRTNHPATWPSMLCTTTAMWRSMKTHWVATRVHSASAPATLAISPAA